VQAPFWGPSGGHHGSGGRALELMGSHGQDENMAVCQNLVPLVNIKIAGKWLFIPLNMVLIGIDPYPYRNVWENDRK